MGEVHEVYRRWPTLAEKYQPHSLLVGEVNLEPARQPAPRAGVTGALSVGGWNVFH